jgi:hypothetical protein
MVHVRWIGVLIVTVAVVVSPVVAVSVVPNQATSPIDDSPTNGGDTDPGEQARSPHSGADTPRVQAPAGTSLVDVDPAELSGSGTPDDPYIITNASELQAMEDDLDAAYRLGNDINASETAEWNDGAGFDPIVESNPGRFEDDQPFTGTFDGAGHSITGLTIERPDTDYVGLFGFLGSGRINDLRLRNVSITGSDNVGGLVGRNVRGTVRNTSVSGTVIGTGAISDWVGGLVGYNEGTVRDASASGTVTGSEEVGGLVGWNSEGTVRNASASGTVNGSERVGGLVG